MADTNKLNLNSLIQWLLEVRGSKPGKHVQLQENDIRELCLKSQSQEIFLSQPILRELEAPLKIVVVHTGNTMICFDFWSMVVSHQKAIIYFLGTGRKSLWRISASYWLKKMKYPENFFLLRGNHECVSINSMYGIF